MIRRNEKLYHHSVSAVGAGGNQIEDSKINTTGKKGNGRNHAVGVCVKLCVEARKKRNLD